MLLGTSVNVPKSFILDAFLDFVSAVERDILKSALHHRANQLYSDDVQASIVSVLARMGCREIPTPSNLPNLIVQVARFEFCSKPAGAIAMIHSGIPPTHKQFWEQLGIDGISELYAALTVSPEKVRNLLSCDCTNPAEERVFGYLSNMIDNMGASDVRNFLRFTTGSSVCVAKNILVSFNTTSGFGRRPFATTCSNRLSLPLSYVNYHDFFSDWCAILRDTTNEWMWCMDDI